MWTRFILSLTFVCLLFFPHVSGAEVDLKTGAYIETWTDIFLPGAGFNLTVQRSYNSASTYKGMFGYGWCSDYEASLEPTPEGAIKISECGTQGHRTVFTPGGKNLDAATASAAAEIAKKLKLTGDAKDRLMRDSVLRTEYATRAQIQFSKINPGQVFSAPGMQNDQVTFDGNVYVRKTGGRVAQKFSREGRLLSREDMSGNWLHIDYTGTLLTSVSDNKGRRITFKYPSNGRQVELATASNGMKSQYNYNGGKLTEATNATSQKYAYKYQEAGRLAGVAFPDKSHLGIKYDKSHGWVTEYNQNDKCVETFTFTPAAGRLTVATSKKCGTGRAVASTAEFSYSKAGQAPQRLSKVTQKSGNAVTEVNLDPKMQKVKSVRENNAQTAYTYFPDGSLKTKTSGLITETFSYAGAQKKLSRVVTETKDPKGRRRSSSWIAFTYDVKGRLATAKTSTGRKLDIDHDASGRIASIKDSAVKKTISLAYDDTTGLIKSIREPKTGALEFKYDRLGRYKTGRSSNGIKAADSLGSILYGVLEILRPATGDFLI